MSETKTYPTAEAWGYFMLHLDDIRAVCKRFLPIDDMEVPNTRRIIYGPDQQPIETDARGSVPLPVNHLIEDFDQAVRVKDSVKLTSIMNDAWLRLPESRSVYSIPGVTPMCNLLDGTVDGFFPENGPDNEEEC